MSFARSLFTVSGLTVISRVSGFVRDTLTAMLLGAGPIADAAFVAQRLPNLFRSLFAEGAFSSAFVPLYTTEHQKNGFKAAQHFAGQALALLLAILIPFSIFIMLFMPFVIRLLAPGFHDEPEKYNLTVQLSLIAFPYLTLISITALQGGVLNAQGRFAAAAAAPISLNLVIVAALILAHFYGWHAGYTISWAFLLSGVVQASWLAISCYRAGTSLPLTWPRLTGATLLLFKRIGPGALGAGAAQINMLLSTILASTLTTGAVSWLSYADRLQQLPLGIIGIAVSTTLLPLLSRHVEAGAEDNVRHYTSRALEFCIMLGLPAAMGLVMLAHPIVQTLFEHGAFEAEDTLQTAEALAAYAFGVPAFLLVKVFSAGFFARHDTATPVKLAIAAMVTNVAGAFLLLGPLQHVGIALANSVAIWVNALLLLFALRRRKVRITDGKMKKRMPRILVCVLGMSLVTLALAYYTKGWFADRDLLKEITGLGIVIG
ncbi:MAG: murein biosynthesis integral membrane protein MurJ, partial [Bdellovibrionales bacterium]